MNKPKITYNRLISPYWMCADIDSCGYGVGIGDTPEEAYYNYIRQSWLRRLINWFRR